MNLRSKIFRGSVTHQRSSPAQHAFTYPMTFFGFDLAELDLIARQTNLFGHNTRALISLKDSDYLRGETKPIEQQLEKFLPPLQTGERTLLVSSPRYFGYAFNPVNFYLRLHNAKLLSAVAEVNNTFGDRHIYPLIQLSEREEDTWTASCAKDFHVSPFNDLSGEYAFTLKVTEDTLHLGVDLHRKGGRVMRTWIQGSGHSISNRSIRSYALLHPFDTALNSMPRIIWQAAILKYRKHLKVYKRPSPESKNTLIDRDKPKKGSNL
ncbi:MAG TPA: hypothetical protein DD622_00425 [Opitutae bacterium]|nr:hypothetical protein [Opitutae bacterium]